MVVRLRVEIARLEAAYPADPGLGKPGGSSVHRPRESHRSGSPDRTRMRSRPRPQPSGLTSGRSIRQCSPPASLRNSGSRCRRFRAGRTRSYGTPPARPPARGRRATHARVPRPCSAPSRPNRGRLDASQNHCSASLRRSDAAINARVSLHAVAARTAQRTGCRRHPHRRRTSRLSSSVIVVVPAVALDVKRLSFLSVAPLASLSQSLAPTRGRVAHVAQPREHVTQFVEHPRCASSSH